MFSGDQESTRCPSIDWKPFHVNNVGVNFEVRSDWVDSLELSPASFVIRGSAIGDFSIGTASTAIAPSSTLEEFVKIQLANLALNQSLRS